MPNYVANRVLIIGKKSMLSKILSFIKSDEDEDRAIDFNKIIPMPEEMKGTDAPSNVPNEELIKKYGSDNWYEWSCANWGTKWNVSYCSVSDIEQHASGALHHVQLEFDTAWSCPGPIFEKLSKMYPEVVIEVSWADEDMGYNTGTVKYLDGNETDLYEPEGGSLEAQELYLELHEDSRPYYKLVDGEYIYKEDEDEEEDWTDEDEKHNHIPPS